MIRTLDVRRVFMCAATLATSLSAGTIHAADNQNGARESAEARKERQVVYFTRGEEPPSMDPGKQVDAVSGFWLGHLYEGLLTTDRAGKVVPGTAETMTKSADGKTYTFTIRKDAKWHDGKPVTAHDFVFAFQRLVDPGYASEYSFIAQTAQLANATEILTRKAKKETLGARAVDDRTLVLTLNSPVAFFPSLMSFQTFFPVRRDLVEKHGDRFATQAESIVGNGPFKLAHWRKEASMRLVKAPTYWNAKAIRLTAIEAPVMVKDIGSQFNLYKARELDVVNLDAERIRLAAAEKIPVKSFLDGGVDYIRLNDKPGRVFSNVKLRQAVRFALNRSEYVNRVSGVPGEKPAFGFIPDYMPGARTTYRKEAPMRWADGDLATARKFIAEYLAETKQSSVPSFTILVRDSSTGKLTSEYFQNYFSKAFNVTVKIDSVPFKARLQRMRDGEYDMGVGGWGPDYFDPQTFLDTYTSSMGDGAGGYSNKQFDALIAEAQASQDMAHRVKLFRAAEKILIEEGAHVIPFVQRSTAYVQAPGLTGVVRTQVGFDPDFRYAHWGNSYANKD